MIKSVVLFFACVVASKAFENSMTPLAGIFKNGAIPTDATVHAGIEESIIIAGNLFDKIILPLPDIYEAFIDEHDHLIKVNLTSGQLTGIETLYSIDPPMASVNDNYGFLIAPYRYANFTVIYNYAAEHNRERIEGKLIAEEPGFRCDIGFLTDRLTLRASSYNIQCENNAKVCIRTLLHKKLNVSNKFNTNIYGPFSPINIKFEGKINEDKHYKNITKASVPIFNDLIEDVTKEKLEQVVIAALNDYNANL